MTIRSWYLVHKWTSLVCTAFLLLLCLTGLPLIFHEEIAHLSGEIEAPELPEGVEVNLDKVAEAVMQYHPDHVIRFMSWDAEEHPNITFVSMAPAIDSPPDAGYTVQLDSRTGQILGQPDEKQGFMYIMFRLHLDLFAGLGGMLFLGVMGLLFAVAIISGIVLYHPFMRRLDFGTVRYTKPRMKWLDLHNLLGVVTLLWALVVGLTGTINTLSPIIIAIWQNDQMAEMIAPYKDAPPLKHMGSIQKAMDTSAKISPEMEPRFVAYPGTKYSSLHHYTIFMKGNTPFTSKLLKPVLVDAETGEFTDSREVPWYVKTFLLSQPLHFGDYGGLPLKIIWMLLDMITIVVLVSGLYLWWVKRKHHDQRIAEIERHHHHQAQKSLAGEMK